MASGGPDVSEDGEIKRYGMKKLKNSGRGKLYKGDATLLGMVVDIKEYAKSFSVSRDVWRKICSDAYQTDPSYDPCLMLVLGDDSSKVRVAVVEWDSYIEMREAWIESQS
jgi:hypothetical protein